MSTSNGVGISLPAAYSQLLSIQHELAKLKKDQKFVSTPTERITEWHLSELSKLDPSSQNIRTEANVEKTTTIVTSMPPGMELLQVMVDRAYNLVTQLVDSHKETSQIDDSLQPLYNELKDCEENLSKFLTTGIYTQDDILKYQDALGMISKNKDTRGVFYPSEFVEGDVAKTPLSGQAVLHSLLHKCYRKLRRLQQEYNHMDHQLVQFRNQLIWIQRKLLAIQARPKKDDHLDYSYREVQKLQSQISKIERRYSEGGKFSKHEKTSKIPSGQAFVSHLLNLCRDLAHELVIAKEAEEEAEKPTDIATIQSEESAAIKEIISQADTAFTKVTEGDDYVLEEVMAWKKKILDVDEGRKVSKMMMAIKDQIRLQMLIKKANSLVNKITASSEKVDPALDLIHARLLSLKEALEGLKKHSEKVTDEELRPFWNSLFDIEILSLDGIFGDVIDGKPLSGQATLQLILQDCRELLESLQIEADETPDHMMRHLFFKLHKIRRDLNDLKVESSKKWGESQEKQLRRLQGKLSKIDAERKDCRWTDRHGNIPEGQAVLQETLEDCYELVDYFHQTFG